MAEAHTVWSSPHFALWNQPRALHQALTGRSKHQVCPHSKATLRPMNTSASSYPCFVSVPFFPASSSKYPLCRESSSSTVSPARSCLLRTGGVCELPGRGWHGDPSIPGPFTAWIIVPSWHSRETLVCVSAKHSSAVLVWKKKCFQSLHSQALCISDKRTREDYWILLSNCCKAHRRTSQPPLVCVSVVSHASKTQSPSTSYLLPLPGANAGAGSSETTTISCRDRDWLPWWLSRISNELCFKTVAVRFLCF